jgi:transposase
MTKYASCWRAHGPQKATPRISTSALRGQGFPVLLCTWQWPGFAIASVKETPIRKTLDRFFEDVARAEGGNLLGRDLHLLAGLGVSSLPCLALPHGELPEARDLEVSTETLRKK